MKNIQYYENIVPEIRNTLNSVSPTWDKDQITRFLYKELANYVKRDLLYFLQPDEIKYSEYSCGFIDRFPNIACKPLSKFYCAAYHEFDIDATVVAANSAAIPLYGLIVSGMQGYYFLNPLEDLFLNQYGLMPHAFGYNPHFKTINRNYPNIVKLDDDYLSCIDQSLGFTYLDDYFLALKPIMKNHTSACRLLNIENPQNNRDIREKKLEYFANNFINIGNVNGYFERAQLYKYLNDTFFNKREKRYTKIVIEDGLTPSPYISYTILRRDGNITYHEEKTSSGYVLRKKN